MRIGIIIALAGFTTAPAGAVTVISGSAVPADDYWQVISNDSLDYFETGKTKVTFTIDNGSIYFIDSGIIWRNSYSYFEPSFPTLDNGDDIGGAEDCTSAAGFCYSGAAPPHPYSGPAQFVSDFSFGPKIVEYTVTKPLAAGPCDGTFNVKCNETWRFESFYTYRISANGPVNYTITYDRLGAVPEPALWTMMIAGFGLAGASLRRRRSQLALSS